MGDRSVSSAEDDVRIDRFSPRAREFDPLLVPGAAFGDYAIDAVIGDGASRIIARATHPRSRAVVPAAPFPTPPVADIAALSATVSASASAAPKRPPWRERDPSSVL